MDHIVALKNEQTARIVLRDSALYVFIGAIFAFYAAEGQAGSNANLIYWIHLASSIIAAGMFSIYLSNDFYVSQISRFVASEKDPEFCKWEEFHRKGAGYTLQKHLRSLVVYVVFGIWGIYQAISIFSSGDLLIRIGVILSCLVLLGQMALFTVITYFNHAPASE
jgi:hypothetical protein